MKIFSEKTKKMYDTVEQCQEAEAKWDAEQAALAEKKAEAARVRKERADEVSAAYQKAKESRAKAYEDERAFIELRNKFVNDYGSYHMTVSTQEKPMTFEELFSSLFMF